MSTPCLCIVAVGLNMVKANVTTSIHYRQSELHLFANIPVTIQIWANYYLGIEEMIYSGSQYYRALYNKLGTLVMYLANRQCIVGC